MIGFQKDKDFAEGLNNTDWGNHSRVLRTRNLDFRAEEEEEVVFDKNEMLADDDGKLGEERRRSMGIQREKKKKTKIVVPHVVREG